MGVFPAFVLFGTIWFVVLLVVLARAQPSQAEQGRVLRGTPPGAPANPRIGKRLALTTGVTVAIWMPLVWSISSGRVSLADLDLFTYLEATFNAETEGVQRP